MRFTIEALWITQSDGGGVDVDRKVVNFESITDER